ncbi:surface glycoprotein [Halodesulfurarchaeum sp. HSR-GB]|uniref:surface glycoprotein n=1 Tax=Halodesulfurarchaeum sp. HSR-GB TaxID=3074077 RepID=UPI00285578F7|nr:surface glycoprotein [Halodesulfurarchaeum sp. HSR-GB]MDR5657285.1 surface glycoprotein [Halodesulfurarchaeum sp. HSR-GB]
MKARAIFLSALLVLSVVAGSVALAGGAAAAPSGFVTVDDSQVYSDLPEQTPMGQSAQDIADAGVMSSAHPDSLEVVVTSPGRAKNKIDGGEIHGSGPISIVITDDEHSEGRSVALPAAEIEDALGYQPEMARGTHEDGSPWNSEIEREDGWLIVEIPHFSTNTVSFAGSVEIGDTFTDGSSVNYDISDLDAASDPVVNLTGKENTENESYSWQSTGTKSISVGGTNVQNAVVNASAPALSNTDTGQDTSYSVSTGDIDGDGTAEIVYQDTSSNLDYYDVDTGTNTDTGQGASSVSTGDIDGDGTAEIVYQDTSNNLDYYDVDTGTNTDTGEDAYSVSTGDIDGDGTAEIVYQDTSSNLHYYDVDTGTNTDTGQGASSVSTGDIDGDGTAEIVYPDTSDNLDYYDVDTGTNTDTGQNTYSVSTGDIDGDGTAEIVYPDTSDNLDYYDVDTGTNTDTGGDAYSASTGDIDGDGTAEIVYRDTSSNLDYYDVDTGTNTDTGQDAHAVSTGDIDGDGMAEIVYQDTSDNLDYYDVGGPAKVEFDVDDDGTVDTTLDVPGGGTDSATLSGLTTSTDTLGIAANASITNAALSFTEVTQTQDPGVELNGAEWANHTGTLADGETVQTTLSKETLQSGTNTINVSTPELSADAPPMQVEVDYSHDAQDDQDVDYSAEKFSERYSVSKTYSSDRQNPTLTIPFADTAISIRDAEYSKNGGDWQAADNWVVENTTGEISLPDMQANDTVDVRVNATKVAVDNGAIEVLEPTPVADDLNSKIEITEHRPEFEMLVSGADDDRVIYAEEKSWSEANDSSLIDASGSQTVRFPEAGVGSTATLRQAPLWAEPENDVAISVDSGSEPRFEIGPGESEGDMVTLEYADTVSGETYELRRVDGDYDRQIDTDTAESPVYLETIDQAATYIIGIAESTSVQQPVGPVETEQSGTDPVMILLAVVAALGGLLLVVRSVGGSRISRGRSSSLSIPFIDRSLSLPSLPTLQSTNSRTGDSTSRTIVIGGLVIIALVAMEFATPEPLLQVATSAVSSGAAPFGELLTIIAGVGALLGIWYLDQRTSESIPTWLMGVAAVVTVTYLLETLQPGVLLGPISEGFETVSPLFWIVLIGGGAYLIYGWIQTRRSPDTRVTLQLSGKDK